VTAGANCDDQIFEPLMISENEQLRSLCLEWDSATLLNGDQEWGQLLHLRDWVLGRRMQRKW